MVHYFSLFLLFILTFPSCSWDPLQRFSPEVQDGVLKTGRGHLPLFENALYEKIAKLDIVGQSHLIMEWAEGQVKSYEIRVRLLHDLESKYEIMLKAKNISSLLNGAKWSFDPKSQKGVLKWRPSVTFTGQKTYQKISLPLLLEFKDRRSSGSKLNFVVQKNVTVLVYKSLDPPEVYKIETAYNVYEKLDDGNFWTNYGAKSLELSYYDQIFVGDNKKQKVSDNLKFYSDGLYNKFNQYAYPIKKQYEGKWETEDDRGFDVFVLYDQFKKLVSNDLVDFIGQPFYIEDKIRQTEEDCLMEKAIHKNKNELWCLNELDTDHPVAFEKNIYIKRYRVPKNLLFKNLFYKVSSAHLCEVYHHISSAYIFNAAPWELRDSCYLSAYLSATQTKEVDEFLSEKSVVYLFKGHGVYEPVDLSQWPAVFLKIPESVKWSLGGFKPIEGDAIKLHLIRNKEGRASDTNQIHFYVKDYNQTGKAPVLIPHQRPSEALFWESPIEGMDVQWHAGEMEHPESNLWKLSYNVKLIDEARSKNHFRQFALNLQPVSQWVSGPPVSLQFNTLPKAKKQYRELFDPETDVRFQTVYDEKSGFWLYSTFSSFSQIKARYIFPSNFLDDAKKAILFKTIPFFNFKTEGSLLDYLYMDDMDFQFKYYYLDEEKKTTVAHMYAQSPKESTKYPGANETEDDTQSTIRKAAFKKNLCSCSDWEGYKKDDQVYVEGLCFCEMNIKVDVNTSVFRKSSDSIVSFYLPYDYFLARGGDASLNNKFYQDFDPRLKNVPIELDGEPFAFAFEPPSNVFLNGVRNRFHIFFNLQPSLKCDSSTRSSNRICEIDYFLDQLPKVGKLGEINKEKSLFSEKGIQPVLFCDEGLAVKSGSKEKNNCPCSEFPVFSKNSIQIRCEFKKDQKGSISVHLETDNPYIYFLNIDRWHNEESYHSCLNAGFPHPTDCQKMVRQEVEKELYVKKLLNYGSFNRSHKRTPVRTFQAP